MGVEQVKNIVLVLSGKGGVGKTTISSSIALTLLEQGFKVGLLDIDLTGPSVPYILSLTNSNVSQSPQGWIPVSCGPDNRFKVMSLGFLLPNKDDPVIWRGPKKTAMVQQLVNQVVWGELDYLIVDTPPGTSDEHISIMEKLKDLDNVRGSILVTTPQGVAVSDVRKELNFCDKVGLKVLGIIENMSGYVCPHCKDCSNVFSSGGGAKLASDYKCTFLGAVPIDPQATMVLEKEGWINSFGKSPFYPLFADAIQKATI